METWFIILVSIFIAGILKSYVFRKSDGNNLPPGPSFLSSHLLVLTNTVPELQLMFRKLMSKYGPIFSFTVCSHPLILVGSHSLAHKILIQKGAIFSDRPQVFRFCNISAASYGPTWRILRRNFASEFLQPSCIKRYSRTRKWVLQNLMGRLQKEKEVVVLKVADHFHHALFSLLLVMCFGYKLDEGRINEIRTVQLQLLECVSSRFFNLYVTVPWLAKILFRSKWENLKQVRCYQRQLFNQLIYSRIEEIGDSSRIKVKGVGDEQIMAYVDTLVKLEIPDDTNGKGRKLTQKDIVSMCSELLNAGTDTTSTTLQWIMANLVKHPHIQSKLYDEIVGVVGPPPPPPGKVKDNEREELVYINEDELHKMPYLKAVVLEGLRRHPPGDMVLPHRVMSEVEVEGYVIPQGATISFMVRDMALDPTVWDDPMEFKPERFLMNDSSNGGFDIYGNKGIKMMPFGAGRRMCPASDLSLLHLEYFVSNLIWYFQWTPNGYHVDLSEKFEFTVVMKNPLQAQISARTKPETT